MPLLQRRFPSWLVFVSGVLFGGLVVVGVLFVGNVFFANIIDCNSEEIARVTSPDGKVDALMTRRNCGTGPSPNPSYSYSVYIVPKGDALPRVEDPFETAKVFYANMAEGLEIRWMESRHLRIEYADARILDFRNFWVSLALSRSETSLYEIRISEGPISPAEHP